MVAVHNALVHVKDARVGVLGDQHLSRGNGGGGGGGRRRRVVSQSCEATHLRSSIRSLDTECQRA